MLQNSTRGVPNVDDGSDSDKDNKSKKKKNKSTDTEQQSKRSKEVVTNATVNERN